ALESRKVQKVGYSTLTVSLPSDWVKRKNIKPGDLVFIMPEVDGSLRIMPSDLARREEAEEYIINADVCDEKRLLERIIVGSYILGRDVIRITSTSRIKSECVEEVRGIVQKLIGLGILEETPKNILLQCSIEPTKFKMDLLVRRLALIASTIYTEAMQALLERDKKLAMDAIAREDEADRMYFLATRLLVLAQRKRDIAEKIGFDKLVLIPCTCTILQYLELIADYSEEIAKLVIELKKCDVPLSKKTLERIYHLGELTQTIFQKAVDCIFTQDVKIANSLLEMHEVLEKEFEQEMHEVPDVPYLRTILSTLSKIADKGAVIANLSINTILMKSDEQVGKILKIRKHTTLLPIPAKRK
ncbi:phosphate uptake regulator PhoU, partial [Candidatus Bathyarchaeota archaeon]|nr:phosphate uptake regulator PhoU [Candidatus Bathyarchaeota archaeon]